MKWTQKVLHRVGVYPIIDQYYEPYINESSVKKLYESCRMLNGIDFNVTEQLKLLRKFSFNEELMNIPLKKTDSLEFYYHNGSFEAGDAEYFYNIIRYFKPKTIIEIGSGNSTLMAINALRQNKKEDRSYVCKHICIEPYELAWLDNVDVTVMREKVENLDIEMFQQLERNDVLFIDSSHVIRPRGDVLFEYLQILPVLKGGVLVHIHDIFTPNDYPLEWMVNEFRLWNEQYLLEAFLLFNTEYKVIGSLNFLKKNYFKDLAEKCPILKDEKGREPGSFWMVRKY